MNKLEVIAREDDLFMSSLICSRQSPRIATTDDDLFMGEKYITFVKSFGDFRVRVPIDGKKTYGGRWMTLDEAIIARAYLIEHKRRLVNPMSRKRGPAKPKFHPVVSRPQPVTMKVDTLVVPAYVVALLDHSDDLPDHADLLNADLPWLDAMVDRMFDDTSCRESFGMKHQRKSIKSGRVPKKWAS